MIQGRTIRYMFMRKQSSPQMHDARLVSCPMLDGGDGVSALAKKEESSIAIVRPTSTSYCKSKAEGMIGGSWAAKESQNSSATSVKRLRERYRITVLRYGSAFCFRAQSEYL